MQLKAANVFQKNNITK